MTDITWLRSRVAAIGARVLGTRTLMRIPIWIYRAGAGGLLGSRFLMLEHIGRKSGIARYVVLEVIGHPTPDSYRVASGFGEQAQWFRNIKANPQVRVYAGGRAPSRAVARVLSRQEADHALGEYARRHPRAWKQFKPVLERTLGGPIAESDTALPIVELQIS